MRLQASLIGPLSILFALTATIYISPRRNALTPVPMALRPAPEPTPVWKKMRYHEAKTLRQADLPAAPREFRAAWVATVDNIDWPSKRGLPVAQQQAELRAIIEQAAQLKLNALIFQIRPACDALYASEREPWSEYLTGAMGRPPDPYYDPLELAIEEAHKRGIELHVWFNPYRARHPSGKSPICSDHISRLRPNLVKTYGNFLWLDPGEPEVQKHSLEVILDVVRRYDIDGAHIDDYFYPYKVKGADGKVLPFPDEPSWRRYRQSGGTLSRDGWRRENVNQFVERLYKAIKAEKNWVKFGVSPFGIYRPGFPPEAKGFDQYAELYADPRKWWREGWMDYFAPQLYWKIGSSGTSFPMLLAWWAKENVKGRHLWPGSFTSRVGIEGNWPAEEILAQIETTRGQEGATGNIHFSMKALLRNPNGLTNKLMRGPYAEPALIPASPWLSDKRPAQPTLQWKRSEQEGKDYFYWTGSKAETVAHWVLRTKRGQTWSLSILPGATQAQLTSGSSGLLPPPDAVAVSAVDRYGNEGPAAILEGEAETPEP
jgi:uncharacterized lipoprotein YddW (UPF0748 family)